MTELSVTPAAWAAVQRAARRGWPAEVCGLLFAPPAHAPADVVELVPNVAPDPLRGFRMDDRALLRAASRQRESGREVCAIFHTHPGGGPALSAADRRALRPAGELLWPGVAQVVLAARAPGVSGAGVYRWREPGGWRRARLSIRAADPAA